MSGFIKFRVRQWGEEDLAKRLAELLCGRDGAEKWPGETRWHLGISNNWWLHPEGEGTYQLHYRYPTAEKMEALKVVLEWLLGVEILEED